MKGIEESTGKRLSEVLTESGISEDKIAVWVGPGHIQVFRAGYTQLYGYRQRFRYFEA